ncbi:MAG: hydrogenase formation protein HypD [Deltaproteobacteria bacterium]|jgi:hydrogenase expression/formation protein HypD|nr:hydrogenase formation protein HypD [Deltaproteobacteria bacterium]
MDRENLTLPLARTLDKLAAPEVCAPLLKRLEATLRSLPAKSGQATQAGYPGGRLRFMEVCGTHTVSIFRSGLHSLLPAGLVHISGPGCPVCVTHGSEIAALLELAARPGVTLATFGDLMRVPGPLAPAGPDRSGPNSLKEATAAGYRVEVVYSPLNALQLAAARPDRQVVFAGVGFETTAPATAAAVLRARAQGLKNFSLLSLHKLIPPALRFLLRQTDQAGQTEKTGPGDIDAFLLPGHVASVLGLEPFSFLADEFGKNSVVSGFEPADILQSLLMLAEAANRRQPAVLNQYRRAVAARGNARARAVLDQVFSPVDALWRGLGLIPQSGLALRREFAAFDARLVFDLPPPDPAKAEALEQQSGCRCGDVLKGGLRPTACPLFGRACTPARPVGPCMVSSEGGCAAYYKYGT